MLVHERAVVRTVEDYASVSFRIAAARVNGGGAILQTRGGRGT